MEEESLTLLQLQDFPNQFEGISMVIELDAFVGPVMVVSSCKYEACESFLLCCLCLAVLLQLLLNSVSSFAFGEKLMLVGC
jgi:hypothetical protein